MKLRDFFIKNKDLIISFLVACLQSISKLKEEDIKSN